MSLLQNNYASLNKQKITPSLPPWLRMILHTTRCFSWCGLTSLSAFMTSYIFLNQTKLDVKHCALWDYLCMVLLACCLFSFLLFWRLCLIVFHIYVLDISNLPPNSLCFCYWAFNLHIHNTHALCVCFRFVFIAFVINFPVHMQSYIFLLCFYPFLIFPVLGYELVFLYYFFTFSSPLTFCQWSHSVS